MDVQNLFHYDGQSKGLGLSDYRYKTTKFMDEHSAN